MFTETKTTTSEKKSPFVFEEGGPVHPCTYGNIHDGMSLRDHFASQALTGFIANPNTSVEMEELPLVSIAKAMYDMADAMLEARTLKPE